MVSTVAFIFTAAFLSAQTAIASLNTGTSKSDNTEKRIKKEEREEKRELKKLEGPQVSSLSKTNFYGDFGNVGEVNWERSTYFDEATFTQGNTAETSYYDDMSDLVGTTSAKTFADLPANAQKNINNKYKDYKVANVVFFDDNEYNDTDMSLYDTRFDDEDNYFVELIKDNKQIILRVNPAGGVYFFKNLS